MKCRLRPTPFYPPTMIPIVPPELINLIIESTQSGLDILQLDKETLAACSLVCSTWRSFAQPQLFQDVRLGVLSRPLDQFLAFLEATPHLAKAIRLLNIWHLEETLVDPPAHAGNNVNGEAPAEPADADVPLAAGDPPQPTPGSLCPSLIYSIAMQLSKEAHITLEGVVIPCWPRDTPFPPARARLSRLSLLRPLYETPRPPHTVRFDLLGLFDVDSLLLRDGRAETPFDLEFLSPTEPDAPLPVTRPIARRVELTGFDELAISALLRGGFDRERLTAVSLGSCQGTFFSPGTHESLVLAGRMLRAHSRCIRDLDIAVLPTTSGHPAEPVRLGAAHSEVFRLIYSNIFNLSTCTVLENLTLAWSAPNHHSGEPDPTVYEVLGAIVASAPPGTLRTLKLSLLLTAGPDALARIMRLLVPLIETTVAGFPGLKTITVAITRRGFTEDRCVDVLQSVVPMGVAESGKLRFEHRELPSSS
ncbi:hypothetical protein C2E23DRAFT_103520 [Lenzites betulinus]|nr:hypothetical protein C2E23DRAFT_103520 [Lenzites betulinus]